MKQAIYVEQVCAALSALGATLTSPTTRIAGNPVRGFARPQDAQAGDIVWLRGQWPEDCRATFVITDCDMHPMHSAQIVVTHKHPRAMLAGLIKALWPNRTCRKVIGDANIHATAEIGVEPVNIVDGEPFPSVGGVQVHDGARIDAFATVVRGSIIDTRIDEGAYIGAHVNIGHDTWIGAETIVIVHTAIAGWVKVGKRTRIYQGARVKNGVTIGDDVVIGMGSVVLKDVPSGETWAGNPAQKIRRHFAQGGGI